MTLCCLPLPMLFLGDLFMSALIAAMFWGLRNPGDFGGLTPEEYAKEEYRRAHPQREVAIYLSIFAIVFVFITAILCIGLAKAGRL